MIDIVNVETRRNFHFLFNFFSYQTLSQDFCYEKKNLGEATSRAVKFQPFISKQSSKMKEYRRTVGTASVTEKKESAEKGKKRI